MATLMLERQVDTEAAASAFPSSFVAVSECLQQGIDRRLGYFGNARFVFFYYEPRGSEVVWNDGRSYGFGSGGWLFFLDEIVSLADRYGVEVGDDHKAGEHVLVIDRRLREAFFADREQAEAVVGKQKLVAREQAALAA
jgi:hypothetical protein